jgi:hypothetical protein
MKIKFATTVASTVIVINAIAGTVYPASAIEKTVVGPDFLVSQQPTTSPSPPTYGRPKPTKPPKKVMKIVN